MLANSTADGCSFRDRLRNSKITYEYNFNGNRTSMKDERLDYGNERFDYQYDELDRVTRETYPDSNYISWGYDTASRLRLFLDPEGKKSTYSYNTKSQLSSVENRYDDTWDYTYDSTSGLLERIDYPTNAYTTFAYDSMDRLRSMINRDKGGKILSQFKYYYDANSNVEKVELRDGDETTYSYDGANRLLGEWRHDSSGNVKYYYRYVYDACGNRTQKVYFDGSKHITTYSYNNLNQLTSITGADGPKNYSYDNNGNLTGINDGQQTTRDYLYTVDNRMTRVRNLTGTRYATTFTYDPQGRLLKRIKKDGTELMYYYHGMTPYLVKKKSGENWVTHQTYTLAPGALGHIMHVRTIDGSTEDRYYHYDRLGNVMNVTDENGLALVNYVQEGFGNVLLTQEDFARLEMHSPIAAYDFPEGSGTTTDDRTSNNYDGTISGAGWTTGEFTYGLSFDGTNDKVSFSSGPSTSGSFSVAAWVKIDSTSGFCPVATNYTPEEPVTAEGWRFGINDGKVCLQLKEFAYEEPYEALGTTTLSTSKWYLIAATYDSSTDAMKVYVNGTDNTSGSPTGDYTTGDNFGIGWDGADTVFTEYYDGLIDSVAVYNAKLSATQVKKLWDSGDTSSYHLTTKEYDPDTGLYYFWQRWYNPNIGRFLQADVISLIRLYTYARNNPLLFVDYYGSISCGMYGGAGAYWCCEDITGEPCYPSGPYAPGPDAPGLHDLHLFPRFAWFWITGRSRWNFRSWRFEGEGCRTNAQELVNRLNSRYPNWHCEVYEFGEGTIWYHNFVRCVGPNWEVRYLDDWVYPSVRFY